MGVAHQSGTKAYLHSPIIPQEPEMKNRLLCVCARVRAYVHARTYCSASELLLLKKSRIYSPHVGVMCLNETSKPGDFGAAAAVRGGND